MTDPPLPTGYGPRREPSGRHARLIFDGDERNYEKWEVKFIGYMRLQKLKETILSDGVAEQAPDVDKNEEAYAELIQFLDDTSLSLVMRDAVDDGNKALKILREHYAGGGKPRIISLYTELTSLIKTSNETVTNYVIRAETAASALKSAKETVSDSLLIAMVLKGLPDSYKPFVVVITQSDKQHTFCEFRAALRSFEDTERARSNTEDDSIMKTVGRMTTTRAESRDDVTCYKCGQRGHIARNCRVKKLWCSYHKSTNHTDSTCRRKDKRNDNVSKLVDTDTHDEEEHSFLFKVDSHFSVTEKTNMLLVDCGATTHIITDESKFVNFDDSFKPEQHYIELANGSRSNNIAEKRGDVKMTLIDSGGKNVNAILKNALFIPSYPQDIFSVQAATERGASVTFQPNSAELVYRDGTTFDIDKIGRLYYLKTFGDNVTSDKVNYTCDLKSWHEILGHCNYDDVVKLQNVVDGMKIIRYASTTNDCDVCTLGKLTQSRSRIPDARATVPLELVHSDLAGPIEPASREGFKYAISFTDDYSGAVFVYLLKKKSDTVTATEKFLADCAPYGDVKCIRSDNGTEYTSSEFNELLTKNRIRHDTSAPYSPHQNGTAERHWRTLFEMARCLLVQADLNKELWPYAVMAAAYIRNRCYNNRVQQTPYFILTGRQPNLSNMRVFGSECYAYKQNKRKLDTRCTKGIFVGYDRGSPAYLVYFPETGKVMRIRIVKFNEKSVTDKQTQTTVSNTDSDEDDDFEQTRVRHDAKPDTPDRDGAQNDIPNDVETEALEIEAPANVDTRYPRRVRKPPAYLADYTTDQMFTSIDYCYRVSNFPETYEQAINSPDSDKWRAAMQEEMTSLTDNDTFTLTALPEGKHSVGGRWVYNVKETSDGSERYKARYVAKGYSQVRGIDYQETFAPTASMTSVRVLMQLAAQHDLIMHQMDVKIAYLNAPIDCEIYMDQAEGFEILSDCGDKLVYALNKSLYGLKQSGRNWNSMLHNYLIDNDFVQCTTDMCVYTNISDGNMIALLIWVDDLIIAASSDALLCETKQMLNAKFHMKDLGKLSYFLGIDFDQSNDVVTMNQSRYISKMLERFDMSDCKPRSTPSEQKLECNDDHEIEIDPRMYREVVGSLIYAMTCTRPDICWIVTKLSQYLSKPSNVHWVAAKHVLRYLKGTQDYKLCYRKCEGNLSLIGYSDADWASSLDDRRSTTGYCFSLTECGPLISWKSRKQPTVALSTCEAEYIALAATIQEGLYLIQLLNEMDKGCQYGFAKIFEDNQGTIALSKNPVNRQRSKHIDIRYHFIRTELNNGRVVVVYCPTEDMIADIMTKPATKFKLNKFKAFILGQ